MQIFPKNVLFPVMYVVFLLIFHFKKPLTKQQISFSIIILIANLIFNHNPNLNITRKELFLFATSKTHFMFNSKLYNQIDGVTMGCPLAPVFATIFMGFHESKQLNENYLNKPKFYLRYVDDILAAFDNEQDLLNFLNNRHPNIKFTIEIQNNRSIAFLVVFISGINNQISHFKHITNQPIQDYRGQEFYNIFIEDQFNQMSDRHVF